jgi:hypothetical protein
MPAIGCADMPGQSASSAASARTSSRSSPLCSNHHRCSAVRSATSLAASFFPQELAEWTRSRRRTSDSLRDERQPTTPIGAMPVCARAQRHPGLALDLAALEDDLPDAAQVFGLLHVAVEARQELRHEAQYALIRFAVRIIFAYESNTHRAKSRRIRGSRAGAARGARASRPRGRSNAVATGADRRPRALGQATSTHSARGGPLKIGSPAELLIAERELYEGDDESRR